MKIISHYTPPTAQELAHLKESLNATSQTMADLCGLAQGQQWRKYTGGSTPRVMGLHMHFYMAALLTLDEQAVAQVLATMRGHGAALQVSDGPALDDDRAGSAAAINALTDAQDGAEDWAALRRDAARYRVLRERAVRLPGSEIWWQGGALDLRVDTALDHVQGDYTVEPEPQGVTHNEPVSIKGRNCTHD